MSRCNGPALLILMLLCPTTLAEPAAPRIDNGDDGGKNVAPLLPKDQLENDVENFNNNIEDSTKRDYDPKTCQVYSDHKAFVTNPECMRRKYSEYFGSADWEPKPSVDGSVCNVHKCTAASEELAEAFPDLYKGHLQFFGRQGQPVTDVEYLDDCPDAETFGAKYVYTHTPVVLRGCATFMPAYKRWTDEHLRATARPSWLSTQEMQKNITRNDRGPYYKLPFVEFLDKYRDEERYSIGPMDEDSLRAEMFVPQQLYCRRSMSALHMVMLWMSSGATESSVHFDTHDNVMVQLGGTKQVYLVDPQHSRYLYMDYHDKYGIAPMHVRKVDLTTYPRVREVPIVNATVNAGDMLYIPTHWWHQINSLDEDPADAHHAKLDPPGTHRGNMAMTFNWHAWSSAPLGAKRIPDPFRLTRRNIHFAEGLADAFAKVHTDERITSLSAVDLCAGRVGERADGGLAAVSLKDAYVEGLDFSFWQHMNVRGVPNTDAFFRRWLAPRVEGYAALGLEVNLLRSECPFSMAFHFKAASLLWY